MPRYKLLHIRSNNWCNVHQPLLKTTTTSRHKFDIVVIHSYHTYCVISHLGFWDFSETSKRQKKKNTKLHSQKTCAKLVFDYWNKPIPSLIVFTRWWAGTNLTNAQYQLVDSCRNNFQLSCQLLYADWPYEHIWIVYTDQIVQYGLVQYTYFCFHCQKYQSSKLYHLGPFRKGI